MAKVEISARARIDLEHIRADGVDRFGDDVAGKHLRGIRQVFELLARYPLAGQERPEFRQAIRSIARPPHRILYAAGDDAVLVVRIIDQAQDVAAALGSET